MLKRTELFARSSRRQLLQLSAQMDEIVAGAGSTLVREGRPGHSFYLVVRGAAEARRGGELLATFGPGDFFGEISMIDRDNAVATVTTLTECDLLVLGHDQFRRALTLDPDLEVAVTTAKAAPLRANAAAAPAAG